MLRTKLKRFKRDYTNNDIINYLKGTYKVLKKSPTFRDLSQFPGPSPRTIVRRFGRWSIALKKAGIRPQTNQLMFNERTYIRNNWNKMTDKEIANKLNISIEVIKYYRANYKLWKNRKGTAKSTYRNRAFKLYGRVCEVCRLSICEWHHIKPKSTDSKDWCILCSNCHAVITRKLVKIETREDLETKLKPYMQNLYRNLSINSLVTPGSDISST